MPAVDDPPSRSWRVGLLAVVVLGALVRAGLLARASSTGTGQLEDPDNYLPLARSLAAGRGFSFDGRPTAYRPPLYPLVLSIVAGHPGGRETAGVAVIHLALGATTVWLTARAARRLGLGPRRALLAAAVSAFDPVLVSQCRLVMTETLAATLTAGVLAALALRGRRGAALGGLLLGLSALCRPSAWPWVVLTAAARLVPGLDPGRPPARTRMIEACLALGTALLIAAPWAARNARVFGEPVLTTTHGGYTLALANNPVYYREVVDGPPGAVWSGHDQWLWWDAVNRAGRGLSEPEADRRLKHEALRFIATRPRTFARASLQRLGRFWGVAPAGAVYPAPLRIATAVWTVPLWTALVMGLCHRRCWRWPTVAAPLCLIGLTLVHTVYWTDLRMRAAAVPAIAVVAAAARWPRRSDANPSTTDSLNG